MKDKWHNEDADKQQQIFDLLCSKQIFPYSYVTDMSVLQEKQLPPLDKWNEGYILKEPWTQLEYDTAKKTFADLNCSDINEYLGLYSLLL